MTLPPRKISSRDVAQKAGVSQTTVSYVLSGRTDVTIPPATRQRVYDAARELHYRANSSAKAMRRGYFGSISLLLSENPSMSILPVDRLTSILDTLEEKELNLLVSRFSDATLTDREQMPRILREIMADGMLINYNADLPEQMTEVIAQNTIPAIWINSRQSADCVFPDDWDAGKRVTEYLLSLGHSRIAFVSHMSIGHYSFADRIGGYEAAMRSAGHSPQTVISPVDLSNPGTLRETTHWLRGEDPFTALIAYSKETIYPLSAALLALDVSVPGDVSLMAFSDSPLRQFGPTIGTMVVPEREIGRSSVELLLEKIKDPSQKFDPIVLPLTLVPGDTTAPVIKNKGR